MNYILFDTNRNFKNLLPISFTRPVSEIRIGILTIKEKWEKYLKKQTSYYTKQYLRNKYPLQTYKKNIMINSAVLPDEDLAEAVSRLEHNTFLHKDKKIIAVYLSDEQVNNFEKINFLELKDQSYNKELHDIEYLWDIFSLNGKEIEKDYKLLTENRQSQIISSTNQIFNEKNIFIEPGAEVECSVLNAQNGYIYIGKEAKIMENSVIRGSFALCKKSQLKIGTKIYGPTTIGPYSKAGGEINNSVFIGYSNKGHDGFLGNSVIGQWCNLGAGTNNSNLKNNYANVKLWNYRHEKFIQTGLQFCGLIMADHSKCGINTMFNTGTVIGVNSNIYGTNFPRNFVPSFSWGGAQGFKQYEFEKAITTAEKVEKRRNLQLSENDKKILKHVFKITKKYRKNY